MKCFIEIPFLERHNKGFNCLPLSAGILITWADYTFTIHGENNILPRGAKKGKHILSITLGIFYWSIRLCFYKP